MYDFYLQNTQDSNLFGDGNMDVVVNNSGHVELIEGNKKLQMELIKVCLTGRVVVAGNYYGSNIPKLIGRKQTVKDRAFLKAVVASTTETAIEDYSEQQSISVPDDEKVYRLDRPVNAKRDTKDPTIIVVEAVVETESGDLIQVMHQLVTK